MLGSARCFLVPVVSALPLLGCSLETPGRSGRGQPWMSEDDAAAVLDAAGAGAGMDAAADAGPSFDAEPTPPAHDASAGPDAARDATIPEGDATPDPLDA